MKKLLKKKPSKAVAVRSNPITDKIRPIGEVESFLTMLCYGKSGTGKTAFAGSWPKPLLLLDIREKGYESVLDVEGIDVLPIEKWAEIEDVYWHLEGGTKYKTIVVDQLTALQALGLQKVRDDKGMEADEVISQRSWGQISGLMTTWIYNFRELCGKGYHVLFNAHERLREPQEEDDDRIAPSVGSNLMQSVASFTNGAVSVIGNTFIREVEGQDKKTEVQFCMRVGPHAYYAAKIRRPISAGPAPGVIVNPTFDKIMRVSKGENLSKKKSVKRK